jgi:hypothetical protein
MNEQSSSPSSPDGREPATALRADEPMSKQVCLFVFSLLMDGRPVPKALEARAREFAANHPDCARIVADFELVRDVLGEELPAVASEGFSELVLQRSREAGGEILPLVRKLSLAAALLLGLTVSFQLSQPGAAVADDEFRQDHVVDVLRPDPFGPLDLDGGLRELLSDWTPLGQSSPTASDHAGIDEAADR